MPTFKHLKYPTASLPGRTGLRLTSLVSACLALCSLATPAWSLDLRQAYDAAYDKGDYVVAVGAGHGFYVLAHEATAFIYVRGVAAFLAFIFAFS